jgi:hypothetical protein
MHEGDHSILDPEHDHNAHPHHHPHKHDHSHGKTETRAGLAPRMVAILLIGVAVAVFLVARFL